MKKIGVTVFILAVCFFPSVSFAAQPGTDANPSSSSSQKGAGSTMNQSKSRTEDSNTQNSITGEQARQNNENNLEAKQPKPGPGNLVPENPERLDSKPKGTNSDQ